MALVVSEVDAIVGELITKSEVLQEYEQKYAANGVDQYKNPIYNDQFNMGNFRMALTKYDRKNPPRYSASSDREKNYVVQIKRLKFTYPNAEFECMEIQARNFYAYTRDKMDVFVIGAPKSKSQEEAAFLKCDAYTEGHNPNCYLDSILLNGSLNTYKDEDDGAEVEAAILAAFEENEEQGNTKNEENKKRKGQQGNKEKQAKKGR